MTENGKALVKGSAVRRELRTRSGIQVSPEALDVLDRHVRAVLDKAEKATIEDNRRRLDGVVMRRCIR
jgi:hypothetical protein